MTLLRIIAFVLLLLPPLAAGGEAAPWENFAGMRQELDGQNLELRDELIPAHLVYLEALTLALAEAEGLDADAPEHAPAWARAEYLLETSFRLLESTGEYEAFLKATQPLRPEAAGPAEPVPDAPFERLRDESGVAGGLVFTGADGTRLTPTRTESGPVLVDASGGTAPEGMTTITAAPEKGFPAGEYSSAPLVRARAAWLRALALERLGRSADGAAETAGLGLVRDWAVLGPLDGAGEPYSRGDSGIDEVYASLLAPETAAGHDAAAAWRPVRSLDPLGRMFPGALFPGAGARTAFAVALVRAPENMPAVLFFAANAPAAVCVNSTVAADGAASFHVWLRKGWNAILVRSTSAEEDWRFALRLTLPDGSPFPGVAALPAPETLADFLAEAAAAGARGALDRHYRPERPAANDGVSALSRRLAENPGDARSGFYLASLLVARRMMDGPERFDREMIFRRAIGDSGGDPFFTLMAARSIDSGMEGPDREENLRLVLLRGVADAGAAAALVDMGRLYLDVMRQPRRAKEYAKRALSVNPMSLRAGALDYDIAVSMGWRPVARQLLGALVNRHPSAAAARLRLGRAALAGGRHRQALTEFHAVLAVDAAGREALEGAVVALGMLGQTSAAVELLAKRIEGFPYDFVMRLKLADLYRTLGRDEDARRTLDSIAAISPDEPRALAMRAEIDRETLAAGGGRAAEASAPFRQELDLSPPAREPAEGWEYLYFQVEDRLEKSGAFGRNVSFAFRVHTRRAAKLLRGLGVWVENSFSSGEIVRLDLVAPDGTREPFTPPSAKAAGGEELKFFLPPLRTGMTVEAEIAMRRGSAPFLGDYFGHIAPFAQSAPVRLSRYIFVSPRERRIFFRPVNGAPEAMVVPDGDGGDVTRVWEMSDVPAFRDEPFSPARDELAPCVQVSSFAGWDEFARWYWRLIGAQYHAPPELQLLARTLGEGEGSPLAKLDRAAAWVAANIGGRAWEYGPYAFRPVNARSVLSRLSADGKDRTLLLCLLAREYGLEAWPVLSRMRSGRAGYGAAGSGGMELPLLDHFNHSLALVRAPLGGDVLLDAGNPHRPPGVMPSQLFGSAGLVVMPDGSDAITVPDGGTAACEWTETAEMTVDEDGSVLWDEKLRAAGTAAQILRQRFDAAEKTGDAADAWTAFLESLGASPSAVSGEFRDAVEGPSTASWEGRARLRRFAGMEEERAFLTVPMLPGSPAGGAFAYPLSFAEAAGRGERTQDLVLPHGFRISRSVMVRFPDGWRLMNPEIPFTREYPFGSVSVNCETGTGSVFIRLDAEIPGHIVAAEDYGAFREMAAMTERWLAPRLAWERP